MGVEGGGKRRGEGMGKKERIKGGKGMEGKSRGEEKE